MRSDLIDKLTLLFMSLSGGRLSRALSETQYAVNLDFWAKHLKLHPEAPLEDQRLIPDISYGRTSRLNERIFLGGRRLDASVNSCEVIAVWHALKYSGYDIPFPALLRHFSKKGICAGGLFGTSPKQLVRFFRERGFKTEVYTASAITHKLLSEKEASVSLCILTSFNKGRNPFSMIHTMCLTKEDGRWLRHNDSGKKQCSSLCDAVFGYNASRSHPIQLIFLTHPADTL
ncbi:MAG: hypothetical protein K5686_06505 [Lachnospiraceae bacterium]|nr:hypothetical protein [Lachnospiraceae bacterium]